MRFKVTWSNYSPFLSVWGAPGKKMLKTNVKTNICIIGINNKYVQSQGYSTKTTICNQYRNIILTDDEQLITT